MASVNKAEGGREGGFAPRQHLKAKPYGTGLAISPYIVKRSEKKDREREHL